MWGLIKFYQYLKQFFIQKESQKQQENIEEENETIVMSQSPSKESPTKESPTKVDQYVQTQPQTKINQSMSFIKGLIPFFLNSYKKHLILKEVSEKDEQNILKNLEKLHQLPIQMRSKKIFKSDHKYNQRDIQSLMKNQKTFKNLFLNFLNSDEIRLEIKNNSQIKEENKQNYIKAISLMIDELNNTSFAGLYKSEKKLEKYQFNFGKASSEINHQLFFSIPQSNRMVDEI